MRNQIRGNGSFAISITKGAQVQEEFKQERMQPGTNEMIYSVYCSWFSVPSVIIFVDLIFLENKLQGIFFYIFEHIQEKSNYSLKSLYKVSLTSYKIKIKASQEGLASVYKFYFQSWYMVGFLSVNLLPFLKQIKDHMEF